MNINFRRDKKISWELSRLSPQDGDILVLHCNNPSEIDFQGISNALKKLGKNIFMLVLSYDSDIQHLPENLMNQYGWYRGRKPLPGSVIFGTEIKENLKKSEGELSKTIDQYLMDLEQDT